jgi:hypothetical protein
MGVGVWQPGDDRKNEGSVEGQLLERLIACARQVEDTVSPELLEAHALAGESGVMSLDATAWVDAEQLRTEDIIALIRFFTLVEMQVSGWDSGKRSPVIPLVKVLKGRDSFDRELRQWIRASTSNRYLPNGSAL